MDLNAAILSWQRTNASTGPSLVFRRGGSAIVLGDQEMMHPPPLPPHSQSQECQTAKETTKKKKKPRKRKPKQAKRQMQSILQTTSEQESIPHGSTADIKMRTPPHQKVVEEDQQGATPPPEPENNDHKEEAGQEPTQVDVEQGNVAMLQEQVKRLQLQLRASLNMHEILLQNRSIGGIGNPTQCNESVTIGTQTCTEIGNSSHLNATTVDVGSQPVLTSSMACQTDNIPCQPTPASKQEEYRGNPISVAPDPEPQSTSWLQTLTCGLAKPPQPGPNGLGALTLPVHKTDKPSKDIVKEFEAWLKFQSVNMCRDKAFSVMLGGLLKRFLKQREIEVPSIELTEKLTAVFSKVYPPSKSELKYAHTIYDPNNRASVALFNGCMKGEVDRVDYKEAVRWAKSQVKWKWYHWIVIDIFTGWYDIEVERKLKFYVDPLYCPKTQRMLEKPIIVYRSGNESSPPKTASLLPDPLRKVVVSYTCRRIMLLLFGVVVCLGLALHHGLIPLNLDFTPIQSNRSIAHSEIDISWQLQFQTFLDVNGSCFELSLPSYQRRWAARHEQLLGGSSVEDLPSNESDLVGVWQGIAGMVCAVLILLLTRCRSLSSMIPRSLSLRRIEEYNTGLRLIMLLLYGIIIIMNIVYIPLLLMTMARLASLRDTVRWSEGLLWMLRAAPSAVRITSYLITAGLMLISMRR